MITLQQAKEMVSYYIEAEKAVLAGKTVEKGDRKWSRENLPEIRKGRVEWEGKVSLLSVSPSRRGPSAAVFE